MPNFRDTVGDNKSHALSPMTRSFRASKRNLFWAIAGVALGVGLLAAIWFSTAPFDAELRQWWISILLACFVLLCFYAIASSLRKAIVVEEDILRFKFTIGTRRIKLPLTESVTWRSRPAGGSIRLITGGKSTTISLGEFNRPDRLELIRLIRRWVPHDRQHNWPSFCQSIALPLREGFPSGYLMHLPATARVWRTRRDWDRISAVLLILSTLAAIVDFAITRTAAGLSLPVVVIVLWLLIRYNIPIGGQWELRAFGERKTGHAVVEWILLVPAFFLLKFALEWCGFAERTVNIAVLIATIAAVSRMFHLARQIDKQRAAQDMEQTSDSEARWNALEPSNAITRRSN